MGLRVEGGRQGRTFTLTLRRNVSVSASIDFVEKKKSMFYCLLITNVLKMKKKLTKNTLRKKKKDTKNIDDNNFRPKI